MEVCEFHVGIIIQIMNLIIGIDEVGRGPLAGPVTVGVFSAPANFRTKLIKILGGKIKDSKQLSPTKRESIFAKFLELKKARKINFAVSHVSNKIIDKKGISYCINYAIKKLFVSIKRRAFNTDVAVRLDGLLKAPSGYKNQKTIIGGDSKNIFIACASIVAKVCRDRLMCRLAYKHPKYSFEIHKGYGTALHRKLIKKHGISELHRVSFCSKI